MNIETFLALVQKLERKVVIHNNSSNGKTQIPLDQQIFTSLV